MAERQPPAREDEPEHIADAGGGSGVAAGTAVRPKGHRAKPAMRQEAIAKGMPMIVTKSRTPASR
ncbi:hypothetical protein SVIO_062650 [Streptomyces violaceusniger]|uniref:Uncharacterized protein n=1 Tax=Streptomyces violaceusniger TaxID=68280 RepID=A0A4D4L3F8_STRVO|nr:hypothetical protein SVIO_062650 [Streptomyces violaceusniger]